MPNDLGKPGSEGTLFNPSKITEIKVTVGIDEGRADQMLWIASHFDVHRLADGLRAAGCDDSSPVKKHGPWGMDREGICDDGGLNEVQMFQIYGKPLWMK